MHLLRQGPPVRLDADVSGDEAPKWIQVAYAGAWKGHMGGPFEFTRETFESFVRNFRAHPSYKAGADGVGSAPVLAFDFGHASEMPASSGDIPTIGTPAQAWTLDLDIREGADGKVELWALTQYLEPARTYVREGKYKWTSVSAWFDATDPVSGEDIGPCLTSIAFTNNPFLQGMVPIAATRTTVGPAEPAPSKDRNMDLKALLTQSLKLKVDSDETAILLALNKRLEAGDDASGQAAEATDALTAILGALGVGSLDEVLAKVAQLLTDSAALAELKPQIDALKQQADATEAAEVEQDVEQALASYGMPQDAKTAVLLIRKSGKEVFSKYFPAKPSAIAATSANLTVSPFVQAATNTPQINVSPDGAVRLSQTGGATGAPGSAVSLARYVGRNITEKAMSYVRTLPESKSMTYDQVHETASRLIHSRSVVA